MNKILKIRNCGNNTHIQKTQRPLSCIYFIYLVLIIIIEPLPKHVPMKTNLSTLGTWRGTWFVSPETYQDNPRLER